ncbi:hypothetical protein IEQ34_013020 [Dendrobium chrysotoxum]|uniref:NADP-dependent oxidoreductase domain-containing protein n=1 Tax=Dendrobium chrysotoxum TaxID=161865 RepID=A0AAV7GNE4_DENCH|nr:hypothetical protein IEQ34_013020 [Dendrobium chrysotoxum]
MGEQSEILIPRVKLGSQGLVVSRLGFGCMGLTGIYSSPVSDEEGISIIKEAFNKGITFFDTSDIYGPRINEILVGKALKELQREKIQLATKFGIAELNQGGSPIVNGKPEYVRACLEGSLQRLGLDYIDLYYQHRIDQTVSIEETVGELKRLVEEGKVKYIGLSEASADTIRRAHAVHPISAFQIEWSLWTRDIEEEIIPLCRELGIGIVPYSPLGRGFFGGKAVLESVPANSSLNSHPRFSEENLEKNKKLYLWLEKLSAKLQCTTAQLALAWVLHQGNDVVPIPGSKRPRTDDTATETIPMGSSTAIVVSKQQPAKSTTSASTSKVKSTELVPRSVGLLSLTINPEYLQRLISSGELGYERPASRRIPEARYYEIDLDAFKRAMQRILLPYLDWKLNEQGKLTVAEIDTEVNRIAPIIVDACITALYSKMRVIHRQYGRYMTRFVNPPTYARDLELPLPFADAIQNFGVYQPQNVLTNFIYIPVFPDGIQNEGRSTEEWNAFKYEAYVPILKSLGIPVKSVDTRIKEGTPWWLYKVNIVDSQFDLRCIFPPSNYSDHSALCASMFITFDEGGENFTPIVKMKNDDPDYPVRFREIAVGFQLRAFSSLCHAPKVEWSQALLEI